MKANEAPEKIYLHPDLDSIFGMTERSCESEVEYTRTNPFIEKAWDWIEDNILSSNQQDKSRSYFEQFKNYMKGE